jgi:hypothetical protein
MTTGGDPAGPAARTQVAWVNGDSAKVLNGLAEGAATLGIGEPAEFAPGRIRGDGSAYSKPNSVSIASPLGIR